MDTPCFFKQIGNFLPVAAIIAMLFFADPAAFAQSSEDPIYVDATATPDSICAGASSQLEANVTGGTSPFTYLWTPSTGLNNQNIANPLASPTVTTWYYISVSDAASHTGNDSVLVSIIPTPPTPGPISGPTIVCNDSTNAYCISTVTGATSYSWMVPAGATIISGQNTIAIHVHWTGSGGMISIIAGNFCGNSNPSVLPVTMTSPPDMPAAINGPALVCDTAIVAFTVDLIPDATSYFWTVPPDAAIVNGQNSDSVTVRWGSNPGDISVIARNICGQSAPKIRSVGIKTLPEPAGVIAGNDTVCSNYETYTYTVPVITGATSYTWMIPAGTDINTGTGTNSIVISVHADALSGDISVEGKNTCGSGTASVKHITVKICAGILEKNATTFFTMYPNPAEDFLNIVMKSAEQQIRLFLVNTTGQIVFGETLENSLPGTVHRIDVNDFSRGVYFVKLVNDQRFYIQRVVIR